MVEGRRVLVTGASSGIGEEMAYQYARMGASVFITARRELRLQRVVEKCKQLGPKTAKYGYVAADMSNPSHTKTVIKVILYELIMNYLSDFIHVIQHCGHNDLRLCLKMKG